MSDRQVSIPPIREPADRRWHILHRPDWGHERDALLPHDAPVPESGLVDVIEVVPAAEVERLREIIARASRMAEQERAGMTQQILGGVDDERG